MALRTTAPSVPITVNAQQPIAATGRTWGDLSRQAWPMRERAQAGKTRVGCAVAAPDGLIGVGVNWESRWRSGDVHAEVMALMDIFRYGYDAMIAVLIVTSDRPWLWPCGSCRQMLEQFAAPESVIGFQRAPDGPIWTLTMDDLLPFAPE